MMVMARAGTNVLCIAPGEAAPPERIGGVEIRFAPIRKTPKSRPVLLGCRSLPPPRAGRHLPDHHPRGLGLRHTSRGECSRRHPLTGYGGEDRVPCASGGCPGDGGAGPRPAGG